MAAGLGALDDEGLRAGLLCEHRLCGARDGDPGLDAGAPQVRDVA